MNNISHYFRSTINTKRKASVTLEKIYLVRVTANKLAVFGMEVQGLLSRVSEVPCSHCALERRPEASADNLLRYPRAIQLPGAAR